MSGAVFIDPETSRLVISNGKGFEDQIRQNNFIMQEDPEREKVVQAWSSYQKNSKGPRELPVRGISLEESLLLQPADGSIPAEMNGCLNAGDRTDGGLWAPLSAARAVQSPAWPIVNSIASICKGARVYHCNSEECVKHRAKLDLIVPKCEWRPFREWLIQIVSCQKGSKKATIPWLYLSAVVHSLYWLFATSKLQTKLAGTIIASYTTTENKMDSIDLFAVCELIYWGIIVQNDMGVDTAVFEKWGKSMVPHKVAAKPIVTAIRISTESEHVICPNRLWSLSYISERQEHDLPIIMDLVSQRPQLRHRGHTSCIVDLCTEAFIDATRIKQMHRCSNTSSCQETKLYFDPDLLKIPIENGLKTSWSLNEPFEVSEKPYVVVSHVWSDGTGVGLAPAGQVNSCLFNYLADIVRSLGFEAIWWDTISIPADPTLRRISINNMHQNYEKAACMLLHDNYLAEFEWADDGSPCLAVVLSPWFTRGWTALECIMAKKIQVIFKRPGTNEPLIKDLDEDVLAKDPSQCHPAHWIASKIIQRLRHGVRLDNVDDLVAILKPRHTSWPRDRMVIAGLLAGVEVDYQMSSADITKRIFRKIRTINFDSVLHGHNTITESGGWSWCPNDLYSLPASESSGMGGLDLPFSPICRIDSEGTLGVQALARKVTREDIWERRILPLSNQPTVAFRVKTALEDWKDCFLLGASPGPFMLVSIEQRNLDGGIKLFNKFVSCEYIAAVHVAAEPDVFELFNNEVTQFLNCLIGRETQSYLEDSSQKLSEEISLNGFNMDFLKRHLWFGDSDPDGELVAPLPVAKSLGEELSRSAPERSEGGTAIHALEAQFNADNGTFEVKIASQPCFVVSNLGIVTDSSSKLLQEKPNFSHVRVLPMWPPRSIPAKSRTATYSAPPIVSGVSTLFFRLEFEKKVLTYSAITPELRDATDETPYRGIWVGFYENGNSEFYLFQQQNKTEFTVVKLTSIQNDKPRGYVVLKITNLQPGGSDSPEVLGKLGRIEVEFGIGEPDKDGNPESWEKRQLDFISLDAIDFVPEADDASCLKYRRVPAEFFRKLQLTV
ncbi:hypothetical protein TWF694_010125 [Orbilia ellipsospora]|uniref:Heterokaryon incompatibility domain-containing protein n=1 Tax=Orbilia ellipsospora TaxID=2528407 RepID=A0AAV9X9A8_9PEZI